MSFEQSNLTAEYNRIQYYFISFRFKSGNVKAVEILLKNGSNPNTYNEKLDMTVLQAAILHGMFYTVFKSCSKIKK